MKNLNPGYYSQKELSTAGFGEIGQDVSIARTCTIVGQDNMSIGSHVRIDGYCTLVAAGSGSLHIGAFIHIGAYCYLSAGDGIRLEDFSNLSQGVKIYSRSDDYSGAHMTNPLVPEKYTAVTRGQVTLGRHVIVGSGSVILPRVTIGDGSAVGALSFVNKSLSAWGVFCGCPARRIKARSRKLLELEQELRRELRWPLPAGISTDEQRKQIRPKVKRGAMWRDL